jgi:Xaa-Pro aminopeptidase
MSDQTVSEQLYPRFSDAEIARRREALAEVMRAQDVDHVLVYGANRNGSAVPWLTRWQVTREALVVHTPGERDLLLVDYYNHVPNARRMATEAHVEGAAPSGIARVADELRRRGAAGRRVGVIGPLGFKAHARLAELPSEVVDLNGAYTRLRLRKSPEELEWVRRGCALTDAGVEALAAAARPGVDELQLGNAVERAYVGEGGTTHIHYFAATSMATPKMGVPAQWPTARRLEAGDALTCEISAAWWDHPGQVLRTFAVAGEPTAQFSELQAVADAAFDAVVAILRPGTTAAEVVAAARVIEDAGYTTRDDLLHGFVGGYLPPVLGSDSRLLEPIPDFTFEAGMTVVVQPNVCTLDETAGVQTGELLHIGPDGCDRLHAVERGLLRVG